MSDETTMGRPKKFGDAARLSVQWLSVDLIEALKNNSQAAGKTQREYLEHLLRTHPEMHNEFSGNSENSL